MSWLEAFWHLLGVIAAAGPVGLIVGTGTAAGVLLFVAIAARVLSGRRAVARDPGITRWALRARARCIGVLRQRDPDAAGRIRPRGPTGVPTAA